MGTIYSFFFGTPPKGLVRLRILGLANSGKTVLTYKLKQDVVVTTIPTIGCNMEYIEYKKYDLELYDTGGQDRLMPLWKSWLIHATMVWFCIDASNRLDMQHAIEILVHTLAQEEYESLSVCVLLTKSDIPNCVTRDEFLKLFSLDSLPQHQKQIFDISSVTGHNLDILLNWTERQSFI